MFVLGVIVAAVGGIRLLIAAFRASPLWGLGVLFIGPVSLIFVVTHWYEAKPAFMNQVAGFLIAAVGVVLASSLGIASMGDFAVEGQDYTSEGGGWAQFLESANTAVEYADASGDDEERVEIPDDPEQFVGMTLEKATELLGRPRARMKKEDQVILMYHGYSLESDDGKTIQYVRIDSEE